MKDLLDLMQLFAIAQTPEEQVETEEDYLRKGEHGTFFHIDNGDYAVNDRMREG